jgi:hypothetical protein
MTTPSGLILPKLLNSSSTSEGDTVGDKFLTYTDLISSESIANQIKVIGGEQ